VQDFNHLKEFEHLLRFFENKNDVHLSQHLISEVRYKGKTYPIYALKMGPDDPTLPTLGLFGGVHGLEQIGSQVVINYLRTLLTQLTWDEELKFMLQKMRIVSIPIVNPYGILHFRRSNGNGVDLMRNAPVEGAPDANYKIYRGHYLGPHLPWYRGNPEQMEVESQALCYFVKKEMFASTFSMGIDFHSGFGLVDRLWYPYAKSNEEFTFKAQAEKMIQIFGETHPFHIYQMEAQSESYTTHGDLWDYLSLEFDKQNQHKSNIFIPWTLEMGSWIWLKKNPTQIFDRMGIFNPMVKHRIDRTMRRHHQLIHFFERMCLNRQLFSEPICK